MKFMTELNTAMAFCSVFVTKGEGVKKPNYAIHNLRRFPLRGNLFMRLGDLKNNVHKAKGFA
jgi:hypothetical protein